MNTKNRMGAALLAIVVSIVPLVVSACYYQIGLKENPWFSNADVAYDFFLYWKGQMLILLCGLLALYTAVRQYFAKDVRLSVSPIQLHKKYMIPLAVYIGLAVLSTVLSGHRDMALWGGYEQWEGMIIICAYGITLFFSYLLVTGRTEIRIVMWGLLVGVAVLSFLGAMQYFGYDFFRSKAGMAVMNFMAEKKLKFTFKFEVGRVYATLNNPNYVGSYVALVLPAILSLVSFHKRKSAVFQSGIALFSSVLLVIMLFGSQSVTGCIGVFATFILFAVYFVIHNKRRPGRIFAALGASVAVIGIVVGLNRPVFEYGVNKITNPAPDCFEVKSLESQDGFLYMRTSGDDLLKLSVTAKDGVYEYEATDGGDKIVGWFREGNTDKVKFQDERFSKIEISEKCVVADGEELDAFVIETPSVGKEYTIVLSKENDIGSGLSRMSYRMYNPFDKVDGLRHIESIGFEKNQHFGSRRGYIWSRTFPLLKRHILYGSGPNTFVYEFPNDDYVGMKNVGYDGAVVTKPHNMFLQIWVQTGFVSLLAFLALYGLYFVESIRLYFLCGGLRSSEKIGLGIMLGTFGYIVTGLANDSTVAVAPLYWCLLGTGMAVNRYNRMGNRDDSE